VGEDHLDRNLAFDRLFEIAVDAGAEDVRFATAEEGEDIDQAAFEVSLSPDTLLHRNHRI
jgi:hypothetical protein